MSYKESGSARVFSMATITIISGAALLIFPTLISGAWQILGWLVVGASAVSAGVFQHQENIKKKLATIETQRKLRLRNKNRKKAQLEREEKIEHSREQLAKKDEKQDEKRAQVKAKVIKQAQTIWSERVEHAQKQEKSTRTIIEKTSQMDIRDAIGKVAIEWNEATTLAQWTMEQIEMFSRLPDATKKAREEAQDAIIESIKIKESGGLWTAEKGKELAAIKEKARLEAQAEEKRIDTMRDKLTDAEIKWRAVERRVERWTEELGKAYEAYAKLKE